jgi:hypothetical protein
MSVDLYVIGWIDLAMSVSHGDTIVGVSERQRFRIPSIQFNIYSKCLAKPQIRTGVRWKTQPYLFYGYREAAERAHPYSFRGFQFPDRALRSPFCG